MAATQETQENSNLPADSTRFIGRRRFIDATSPALSTSRLITMVGEGGVGKTRAAIQLGRSRTRAIPDGVWLVDLAAVDDPELVPRAVAAALGIHDQSQRDAVNTVVAHLAGRDQLLLILDNCEHVSAAVAQLADALLRGAPNAHMLATSRQPLGVPGEHVTQVPPMGIPGRSEVGESGSLDALAHHDAVRLFLDRAADAGADLTDHDAAAVGRLVRALEGVPLAIELAAARTATMSTQDIVARLNDPLRLLSGADRIAHPHHHLTLKATLTWSYDLCSPAEQCLWARLAIFTGGFDLAAVEAVCADERLPVNEIFHVIGGLARQSLIRVEREANQVRYRMLETVRAYGLARLGELGEVDAFRQRHRSYYRTLTDQAARDWYSPREMDWLSRIRLDMPNIRTALTSAVTSQDTETGLSIVINLSSDRGWFLVGTLSEARYWFRTLLAQQPNSPLRLVVLTNGAWIAACQGDRESALSIIADCLRTATNSVADTTLVAFVKAVYQVFCNGHFNEAVVNFTFARDGLLMAGEHTAAHMARLCRAIAAAADTDAGIAFAAAEECLADADQTGAAWAASWAQWAYGLAHLRHGDPRRADTLFRSGLRTQHAAADHWGPVWSIAAVGWAAAATGDHERAALLMGAAFRQQQAVGIDVAGQYLLAALSQSAVTTTRAALGGARYLDLREQGATLDYDEAVATALNERTQLVEVDHAIPAPSTAEPDELTRREGDVARLLASDPSMTNKDMASRLYLSVRTVDSHITHILRKLGLTSRSQIAVWAATHTERPSPQPEIR